MALSPVMSIGTLADFLWSQTFQKFPQLKVSLTEGDIGWIPYFVQKAEHTWERHGGWTEHDFGQDRGPEEIFHNNILVCFIDDRWAWRTFSASTLTTCAGNPTSPTPMDHGHKPLSGSRPAWPESPTT